MDIISEVPRPIQHHILSFLERKEVTRASILSKEWRSIVQSHPVLEFYHYQLEKVFPVEERSRFLLNHVGKCIMKRAVEHERGIQQFILSVEFVELDCWERKLNGWMQQLVEGKVKDLALILNMTIFDETRKSKYFMLTPFVFMSETITHLKLGQCGLGECRSVSLPNLLTLTLIDVPLSHTKLKKILFVCPNLEILKLELNDGLSRIRISGLARLIKVELKLHTGVTGVKIVAPKLRVFKLSHNVYWQIYDITSIELLACESTLRKLRLSCLEWNEKELESLVSKFLGLEELGLFGLSMTSVEIPNQKIRKIKVSYCKKLERVDIDATKYLRVLKYRENKFPFYSIDSGFSPTDAIEFYAYFEMRFDSKHPSEFESWIDSFKELFLNFSQFKDIKMIVNFLSNRDVIVFEEFDENFIKMLHTTKEEFSMIEVVRCATYDYMLDNFFDMFRDRNTIYVISRNQQSNTKFFQALGEKILKENGETNCCRCYSDKCWKHTFYMTRR